MIKEIESFLKFQDYTIENFLFKKNDNFHFDEVQEVELNLHFSAQVLISEDKDRARIGIRCKIYDEEFENNKAPFFIDITMNGYFGCTPDITIDKFEIHGMAIMLPYIRSIITSFTAQAGISPVIIPPINVYKVFKK